MIVEVIAIGVVVLLVATGVVFLFRDSRAKSRYNDITERCPKCKGRGRIPKNTF
jgi:hypothetical protein